MINVGSDSGKRIQDNSVVSGLGDRVAADSRD